MAAGPTGCGIGWGGENVRFRVLAERAPYDVSAMAAAAAAAATAAAPTVRVEGTSRQGTRTASDDEQ